MKRYLSAFAVALLFASFTPLNAIVVTGNLSGAITGKGGALFPYAIGAPVTGSFRYDSDLLTLDPSGYYRTGYTDPWVNFVVVVDGQGFAGWNALLSGLSYTVDVNGLPLSGSAASLWDLSINGGALAFVTSGENYALARVTYTTPEAGSVLPLIGLVLAGLVLVRRFLR